MQDSGNVKIVNFVFSNFIANYFPYFSNFPSSQKYYRGNFPQPQLLKAWNQQ